MKANFSLIYKAITKPVKIFLLIAVIILICSFILKAIFNSDNTTGSKTDETTKVTQQTYSTTEPDSLWVLVSKNKLLPDTYVPSDLTEITLKSELSGDLNYLQSQAHKALIDLFTAANAEGHELTVLSAYRSYQTQDTYFSSAVSVWGEEEALKVSAPPGASEHQTGYAVDLGGSNFDCHLYECFGEEEEGIWLAKNAHKFGFTLSFPQGKEEITTYSYEPWHFRYVGVELANKLYDKDLTIAEYLKDENDNN